MWGRSSGEGNSGSTSALFTVTMSVTFTDTVTVDYTTAADSATAGEDYTAISGTLTFAPGEISQRISVTLLGDTTIEEDESFHLTLSHASQAPIADSQALGTILDDDFNLSISDRTFSEGNHGTTDATFTVTLSAVSTETITVDYATADGTAIAGTDHLSRTGSLTFEPGETSKTITVPFLSDSFQESNESFSVNLSHPHAGAIYGFNTHLYENDGNLDLATFKNTIDEMAALNLGQSYIRFALTHWDVFPRTDINTFVIDCQPTQPINCNPDNLALYDEAIRYAKQKGIKVFLVTTVPLWAQTYSDPVNAWEVKYTLEEYQLITRAYYAELTARWADKVEVWQLFNEANKHVFDSYAEFSYDAAYLDLFDVVLETAVSTIQETIPDATITINPGGWPYDEAVHASFLAYLDALGHHTTDISLSRSDIYPDDDASIIALLSQRTEEIKNRYNKPVFITETGLCTDSTRFDAQDQITYIPQHLDQFTAGGARLLLLYQYQDNSFLSGPCENTFGLKDAAGVQKLSYLPVIEHLRGLSEAGKAPFLADAQGIATILDDDSDLSLLYVDDEYTPATPAWEVNHFASMQEGINNVPLNGTVNIASGSYTESVTLNTSANLVLHEDIVITGGLTIADGTFTAPAGLMTVSGGFAHTGGIFTPNGGRVLLNNTTNQTLATTFDDLILNDGLIGYWKFDEGSGTLSRDLSGYAHHGTLTNLDPLRDWSSEVPTTTVKNAYSLDVAGREGYVAIESHPKLALSGGQFTQALWIYPTHSDTDWHGILGYHETEVTQRYPSLWVFDGTKIHGGFGDGTGWYSFSTDPLLTLNAWSHVAVSFDQTGYKVYVNGGPPVAEINWFADKTPYPISQLTIGKVDNFFEGRLDEVRLYNRALSQVEIQQLADGNHPDSSIATTTLAAQLLINGNLTLNSGTLDVDSTANYSITIAGNFEHHGGLFNAHNGTVTFNGNTTQTLTSAGISFHDLVIAAGSTLIVDGNPTINGSLTNQGTIQQAITIAPGQTGTIGLGLTGATLNLSTNSSTSGGVTAGNSNTAPPPPPSP